jgi:hypothetical protein
MAPDIESILPVTPLDTNGHTPQASPPRKKDDNGGDSPLTCDTWIYRMVVGLLGIVMVTGIIGAFILALDGKDKPPDIFLALGSAAVGALAGILAPSPNKQ